MCWWVTGIRAFYPVPLRGDSSYSEDTKEGEWKEERWVEERKREIKAVGDMKRKTKQTVVRDILHPCFCLSFLIMHRGSCCIRKEIENSLYVFGKEIRHFYMHEQPETKDV